MTPIGDPPRSLDRLRVVRQRLLASGTVVAEADGRARQIFPVGIDPNEGRVLHDWVRRERATRTLESGLGFGISTLFIVEALLENDGDGRHVATDPNQFTLAPTPGTTYAGAGLQIIEEAGVRDLVEFFPEESQVVFPRLLAEGRSFDLAFIDGNHRFERVFLDLVYSGRLLKEGGIVFVDDVQLRGVERAVRFCVANLGWQIEDEGREPSHEWSVLRTGSHDAFRRPMTDFIDA
jgi:predicted O-methyltransferase YrrM